MTIGTLVAFTTLQTRLFWPIQSLLNVGVDIQTSGALFERVFEYLDLPVDIHPGTRTLTAPRGDVALDDVWFRYGPDDGVDAGRRRPRRCPPARARRSSARPARARRRSATSSRASTTRSAARCGSTAIDVRELTFESLADTVGVVSQETYLFHASVRENLRFARPDATDEEIEAAARAAQVHDVIAALPDGYDTVVGERGFRFSGGEKQRIAIARTVLRNPPVLVLDEATSALDVQTERAVEEALEQPRRGPHDARHRAPPLDRAQRRPDRRARRRARGRARHARRAARARRPLRGHGGARRRAAARLTGPGTVSGPRAGGRAGAG